MLLQIRHWIMQQQMDSSEYLGNKCSPEIHCLVSRRSHRNAGHKYPHCQHLEHSSSKLPQIRQRIIRQQRAGADDLRDKCLPEIHYPAPDQQHHSVDHKYHRYRYQEHLLDLGSPT